MTTALPFTENSLRKAMRAAQKEGLHVVGIKPDGTLLVSSSELDAVSASDVIEARAQAEERRRWTGR